MHTDVSATRTRSRRAASAGAVEKHARTDCKTCADPARSVGAMASAACIFPFVALFEETLFRGFVFQWFVDGAGAWTAMIVLSLVFAVAHWGKPDMTGATGVWATIDTGLGAIVLGLGYLRTRTFAFPIGFHFAWNWTGNPPIFSSRQKWSYAERAS